MCGFTGFWELQKITDRAQHGPIIQAMTDTIASRGPDGAGQWHHDTLPLVLGHRRLAIVDLSSAGHQPMVSQSGRMCITYNGEVYNGAELRAALAHRNIQWRGHSDTEVLLEACEAWGIQQALERCIGMFAFALWDNAEECLYLARDRMGIKPLYYGKVNNTWFFGSQLKSFKHHPAWQSTLNHEAIASFFQHNYIPAPLSIYEGIEKLLPGTFATLRQNGSAEVITYWSLEEIINAAQGNLFTSQETALTTLEELLEDAVKRRLIADVPFGAFLSGGIDSSLIVALMQKLHDQPIKTYTIGFQEANYNEAIEAKKIAHHLGTDHQELYVTTQDALNVIPKLPEIYDEPFADVSQIPTYLVSKLASQQVKVVLTGDGGDELFAGYNRYHIGYSLWQKLRYVPPAMRPALSKLLTAFPPHVWDTIGKLIPTNLRPRQFGDKVYRLSTLLNCRNREEFYLTLVRYWQPEAILLNPASSNTSLKTAPFSGIDNMQYLDTITYLPDDILAKIDRATMAVGLEGRVPLLDHRVFSCAWRFPNEWKFKSYSGKLPLKTILGKYLPSRMIDRPKMGFGVPIDAWLRGPLKEWAHDLLDNNSSDISNFINQNFLSERLSAHINKKRNFQYDLWGALMLQSWLDANK